MVDSLPEILHCSAGPDTLAVTLTQLSIPDSISVPSS